MLYIDEQVKSGVDTGLIYDLFDKYVEHFKLPKNVQVNLSIVDEDNIRQLNKNFREIDSVTDVLSFPYLEIKLPFNADDYPYDVDPENGDILLGDIALCYQRMLEQSIDYGHSKEREACYLVLHGLLHLLGFDHIEEGDRAKMREQEELILTEMGLRRD